MSERYVNGRPMYWRGHRVERTQAAGTSNYSYRTICGAEAPSAYLACIDDPLTCLECALAARCGKSAVTDEEILTPGLLTFPNGGAINVHSLSGLEDTSEVYYARRMPGSDEWLCLRTSVKRFIAGVRQANGTRAIRDLTHYDR